MSKEKKSEQVFAFTTPLPPADFKQKLREAVYDSGHLLYEDTPNGFNLGIERGGHSGGYWYTATLTETEDGTEMRGEIIYRTYHRDGELREDTKGEKIREWLGIMLLIGKLRGKPVEITMSTEEKLTHFMTEVMGCREEE